MVNLALPGDPYVTGFGHVVVAKDEELEQFAGRSREVLPSLLRFTPVKMRKKDDCPEKDVKTQAGLNAVIAFRIMGFDVIDIAEFFECTIAEINEMLMRPAAQRTFEMMFVNFINHNADNLQGRISSYAHKAVDTVIELMNGDKTRDDVKLKAAQDILDRSGANAEQFFNAENKGSRAEDELQITFMSETDEREKINVTIRRK